MGTVRLRRGRLRAFNPRKVLLCVPVRSMLVPLLPQLYDAVSQ